MGRSHEVGKQDPDQDQLLAELLGQADRTDEERRQLIDEVQAARANGAKLVRASVNGQDIIGLNEPVKVDSDLRIMLAAAGAVVIAAVAWHHFHHSGNNNSVDQHLTQQQIAARSVPNAQRDQNRSIAEQACHASPTPNVPGVVTNTAANSVEITRDAARVVVINNDVKVKLDEGVKVGILEVCGYYSEVNMEGEVGTAQLFGEGMDVMVQGGAHVSSLYLGGDITTDEIPAGVVDQLHVG